MAFGETSNLVRHIITFFSILYGVVIGIGFGDYCDLSDAEIDAVQFVAPRFELTNAVCLSRAAFP